MPKIPVVNGPQVQDNSNNIQFRHKTNASAASFGGAHAQQIGQLSNAVMNAGQVMGKIQDRTDSLKRRASVRDQMNAAQSEARDYMTEVYRLKGKDAIDITPEVEKRLNEIRTKSLEGFQDDEERALFMSSYDSLMNGHLNRAVSHQERERVSYDKNTKIAGVENSIANAVAARSDKNAILESEQAIIADTISLHKGQDKEFIKLQVANARDKLHSSILDAYSQDSAQAGLTYLESNWDSFDSKKREGLKKDLTEMANKESVFEMSDQIASSGSSLEEQLKLADNAPEEIRDEVKTRVKRKYDEVQLVKEMKIKEEYEKTYDDIVQNFSTFDEKKLIKFPSDKQANLSNLLARLRKESMSPDKLKTDPRTYYALNNMTQEEFKKVDLMAYQGKLSQAHLFKFMDMQKNTDTWKSTQNANSYINQLTKQDIKNGDIEKASFKREMFEELLQKFPEDKRNDIDTFNKVKDFMYMEVDDGSFFFSEDPYWKSRFDGDENLTFPKPDALPENAIFQEVTVKGKKHKGWVYTTGNGQQRFFSAIDKKEYN